MHAALSIYNTHILYTFSQNSSTLTYIHTHTHVHHYNHTANECNPAYKNQKYVLQTETLAAMTNVFTHQGGNSRTYLYVPASQTGNLGRELFIRSNGRQSGVNHAEDFMYKTLSSNLPQEFWLTRTPCPQCARNFIARYAKSVKKPTIYVTNFYSRPPYGPQQQQEAIECLAKMRANGFKFLLWDWYQFSEDFLATKECKKVVVDAIIKYSKQEKEERDASFDAIMKAIHIANEIGMGKKDADKLCLP